MKFAAAATAFIGLVSAAPAPAPAPVVEWNPVSPAMQKRQGITADELDDGSSANCPGVIFIYARGSTEEGNLVSFLFCLSLRIPVDTG